LSKIAALYKLGQFGDHSSGGSSISYFAEADFGNLPFFIIFLPNVILNDFPEQFFENEISLTLSRDTSLNLAIFLPFVGGGLL
jgi:hypothetical protein